MVRKLLMGVTLALLIACVLYGPCSGCVYSCGEERSIKEVRCSPYEGGGTYKVEPYEYKVCDSTEVGDCNPMVYCYGQI